MKNKHITQCLFGTLPVVGENSYSVFNKSSAVINNIIPTRINNGKGNKALVVDIKKLESEIKHLIINVNNNKAEVIKPKNKDNAPNNL